MIDSDQSKDNEDSARALHLEMAIALNWEKLKELYTPQGLLSALVSAAGASAQDDKPQHCVVGANPPTQTRAQASVLLEIAAERKRQDGKWGGAAHDDAHSTAEFVQWIEDYAGWARMMASMGSEDKARRRLMQIAALAVAAVESIDRRMAKDERPG